MKQLPDSHLHQQIIHLLILQFRSLFYW